MAHGTNVQLAACERYVKLIDKFAVNLDVELSNTVIGQLSRSHLRDALALKRAIEKLHNAEEGESKDALGEVNKLEDMVQQRDVKELR